MALTLPTKLSEKVGTFPESSYGAHLVTLIFDSGRRLPHVRIGGWDEIVDDVALGLTAPDLYHIVDVESEV